MSYHTSVNSVDPNWDGMTTGEEYMGFKSVGMRIDLSQRIVALKGDESKQYAIGLLLMIRHYFQALLMIRHYSHHAAHTRKQQGIPGSQAV